MRKIIYENTDYLELKLLGQNTKELLKGIVPNAPSMIVGDTFKFEIKFRSQFGDGKYLIYDVYNLQSDISSTEPVASINWIRAETSKNGVFISFPGYPFVTETDLVVITFLDAINYNYQTYKFIPYRVDYCIDVVGLEVQQVYDLLYREKLSFNTFPTREDSKTGKLTWFKLPFAEDDLRVYNKKLDISDRETYEKIDQYKDYLKNEHYITRIEIQLNRPKFKKKIIYDLIELQEYAKQALYKKINKYIDTKTIPTKNVIFQKDIDYQEINQQKKFQQSKTMFLAYYNKLLETQQGRKYLKQHYGKIDSELFPIS